MAVHVDRCVHLTVIGQGRRSAMKYFALADRAAVRSAGHLVRADKLSNKAAPARIGGTRDITIVRSADLRRKVSEPNRERQRLRTDLRASRVVPSTLG